MSSDAVPRTEMEWRDQKAVVRIVGHKVGTREVVAIEMEFGDWLDLSAVRYALDQTLGYEDEARARMLRLSRSPGD